MRFIVTSTGDRLFRFVNKIWTLMTLNPSQKRIFSKFFAIFWCSAHFNTELQRNGWRYNQDNQHMKFTALSVDFSGPSPKSLGSRRPAHPTKVVILPLLARAAWKQLQVGTDMLLVITSNCVNLFIGVNVDDLNLQIRGCYWIFWWFPAASDKIRVNCSKMAGDGPAYDIFGIERTFLII